jgi:hypothetical protein
MSELVKFLTGHDEPFFQWREDALKPASSAFEPKKPAFNLLKGPKLSYSVPQGGRPSRRFYCVESDRYSMPTSERVAALFDHFERFTWAHSPFPHHHIGPRLSNEAQLEAAWQVFYTGRLKNVVKHLSTVEDSDPKPRFMMCQVPMRIPNEGATGDDYRLDISIGVDFDDPLATVSGVDCSIEFKTDAVLNDAILDALDLFHDHNGQAWAYKSTTSKAGGTLSAPKLKVHFSSWPKDMDAGLKDLVEQGIAHVVDSATMSHALGHHREFRSNGNRFFSAGCDFERHRVVYSRSAGYRKTGETVKAPRDSFPLISQLLADALDSISAKGRRTGDEKAASQQLLQSATTDVDAVSFIMMERADYSLDRRVRPRAFGFGLRS